MEMTDIGHLMEKIRLLEQSEENRRRSSLWKPIENTAEAYWHGNPKESLSAIPFTIEPEHEMWAKILGFDLDTYYSDGRTYLLADLNMKIYRFENFQDGTPIGTSVSMWMGAGFEATLFGMEQKYTKDKDPWVGREPVLGDSKDLDKLPSPDFFDSPPMVQVHQMYEDMRDLLEDDFSVIMQGRPCPERRFEGITTQPQKEGGRSLVDKMETTIRVLLAGESWVTHSVHIKGFDSFVTNEYAEGGTSLIQSLTQGGMDLTFLPNHKASREFPMSLKELRHFHVVILSDIGSNTLFLHPDTFANSKPKPDRLALLKNYVETGGGLAMIGGYLSFSGIEGKARYQKTPLAHVLPVTMVDGDDRVEVPQGTGIDIVAPQHPIIGEIPGKWPQFLGYNQLKTKSGAQTLARRGNDVFLAVGEYGKGRSLAFASDCGPHWGPPEFVNWPYYGHFWCRSVEWLAQRR